MFRRDLLLMLLLLASACSFVKSETKSTSESESSEVELPSCIYQTSDSLFIDSLLHVVATSDYKKNQRLQQIATAFLGRPYVGHTLEVSDEEQIVINTRELDCLTLVENILAIYRTSIYDKPCFANYVSQIERIRYRKGKIGDYTTRLHYYSDWMYDNGKKGVVKNISALLSGVEMTPDVWFMSRNPIYYTALQNHPEYVDIISGIESKINSRSYSFIPKSSIESVSHNINTGDIIGITTSIKGLDMSHTGMALKVDGMLYLLHASSEFKRVMITESPFVEYTKEIKNQTGIVVLRIL